MEAVGAVLVGIRHERGRQLPCTLFPCYVMALCVMFERLDNRKGDVIYEVRKSAFGICYYYSSPRTLIITAKLTVLFMV